MSERCFRFKPDVLPVHAPRRAGVYEFVMFDSRLQPIVLFIGLAYPGTVYEALTRHLMGRARPTAGEMCKLSKDIYFDYVVSADVQSDEDYKDVAGALIVKHKPRLNPPGAAPRSGKYASVHVEENR